MIRKQLDKILQDFYRDEDFETNAFFTVAFNSIFISLLTLWGFF
jgi:hypothetical protein